MIIKINKLGQVVEIEDYLLVQNASFLNANVIQLEFDETFTQEQLNAFYTARLTVDLSDGRTLYNLKMNKYTGTDGVKFVYTVKDDDQIFSCKGSIGISIQVLSETNGALKNGTLATVKTRAFVQENTGITSAEEYDSVLENLKENVIAPLQESINANITNLQGQIDTLDDEKQDKYDETLETTEKTVVGAINELNDEIENIESFNSTISEALDQKVNKVENVGNKPAVYTAPPSSTSVVLTPINDTELAPSKGDIIQAEEGGAVLVGNATKNFHAVNKRQLDEAIANVESVAKGASTSIVRDNYQQMVNSLNNLDPENTEIGVGTNVLIREVKVPDLWISEIRDYSVEYTFTTNADLIAQLQQSQTVQIGYFVLSELETQYINVDAFATKESLDAVEEVVATKVDKPATPSLPSVIVQLADGTITQVQYGRTTPVAWTIPTYQENGQLVVGTPTAGNNAVSKSFADDTYVAKPATPTATSAITMLPDGTTNTIAIVPGEAKAWTIPQRVANGVLLVGDIDNSYGSVDKQAVNKGYGDKTYGVWKDSDGTGDILSGLNTAKTYILETVGTTTLRITESIALEPSTVTSIRAELRVVYESNKWYIRGLIFNTSNDSIIPSQINYSTIQTTITGLYKLTQVN